MSRSAELRDGDVRLNLLCAYPYMSKSRIKLIAAIYPKLRFLLDSGAFTAWKAGKVVKLDDYCRFLESLPFKPWRYFTLDVVGEPVETRKNYEAMLKRGFTPIPIFTRGEDIKVLDLYYQTSDVVAFGGLVGTQGNKGFLNGAMKCVGKRKCHWLGFTSLPFVKAYRPYMVDTSSWESGAQFATMRLYMGGGRLRAISKQTFRTKPAQEVIDAIASYGFDPAALAKNANWHGGYSINRLLNGASGVRLMMDIQRNLGTLYFLGAAAADHAVNVLVRGYDFETRGTA